MHLFAGLSRRQQGSPPSSSPSDNTNTAATPTSSISLSLGATSTLPPAATSHASTTSEAGGSKSTVIIAVVATLVGVTVLLFAFYILRRLRCRHKNPKYIPTTFLKKRWGKWEPSKHHHRLPDTNDHLEPVSSRAIGLRPPGQSSVPLPSSDAAITTAVQTTTSSAASGGAGVDRNTSVRSVMTLPAYNQHALQNEQVLAREGERGGIDVVIEFPEGADEEEQRREDEMEALYQVRLARRRENEEREERRRLRREARERGDYVALRELQARARASSSASGGRTVEELRAEHDRIKKERQRAVSSVSYADLGVARHDGTRLRANSAESEREGLLEDAASIAASSRYHRRDRSTSSVLSIDTMNSDLPSPGLTRSRANSRGDQSLRGISTSHTQVENSSGSNAGRAGSSPEIIEHEDVPPHSPPGYENISLDESQDGQTILEPPPDYSSPVVGRGEGRTLNSTPSVSPPSSAAPTESVAGRRTSAHLGQMMSDHRASSSSSAAATPDSRRSSRGVGGIPQLPSLRLAHLPSIHIESASPTVRRVDENLESLETKNTRSHHLG